MPLKSSKKFSGERIMFFGIGILIVSFFLMRIETISFSSFAYLFFLSAIFMIWGLIKQEVERRRRFRKLVEETKEAYNKYMSESLRLYPFSKDVSDKELREIMEKESKYREAKNELYLKQLKEKYNLTDYELSEIKNYALLDILKGK